MNKLDKLFEEFTKEKLLRKELILGAGSNRKYFRLTSENNSLIAVEGCSTEENRAFIAMAKHFNASKLPTPRVFAESQCGKYYLQQDLGRCSLFDYNAEGRKTGIFNKEEKDLLRKTVQKLAEIQIIGAKNFDFSVCYPQKEFNERSVFWDLNYFKYCFLKATGIEFQEDRLEDDFVALSNQLLSQVNDSFMYRDFQSRNVMIKEGEPYFIDFQGGRKGPLQYDIASFLWQAKANYSSELREELLDVYLEALNKLRKTDKLAFKNQLKHFVLFRTLQVLGAYGYRGYLEKKAHFLESIPFAIENLRQLLKEEMPAYPYLKQILQKLTELKLFKHQSKKNSLTVIVHSFSYKKGIPTDNSGNGGGFVFDCRAIHNPGRYEAYKTLTGEDKAVVDFLEENGEINAFLENCYQLVDCSVKRYLERGFTDLAVSFGCTGGQHRSVYSAQKMAEHLHKKFGIRIELIHREQNKNYLFEKIK